MQDPQFGVLSCWGLQVYHPRHAAALLICLLNNLSCYSGFNLVAMPL